jgi:8-oxo-dGTP pyrophosphatase MutT (NUDIX family)
MLETVHKVAAYITNGDKLLVFRHVDFPEAGIQIPCGTVNGDENLENAVLREAFEETGLAGLKTVKFLGTKIYDMRPFDGSAREIHRHYFHLTVPDVVESDRWRHWETDPAEGPTEPILFELYWVNIPDELPELSGHQGDMLFHIIADA